jgi:hypothetical protein
MLFNFLFQVQLHVLQTFVITVFEGAVFNNCIDEVRVVKLLSLQQISFFFNI